MKKGKKEHEHTLELCKLFSEEQGHRVIDLAGKSPDLIEVYLEDNKIKINCIDAVNANSKGTRRRSKSDNVYHARMKKILYTKLGFDEVTIVPYTAAPSNL